MGNCIEMLSKQNEEEEEEEEEARTTTKEESEEKGRMRVKVVLRKEELQWLMEQIKEKGGKGLEELLEEIEKGRERGREIVVNCVDADRNSNAPWRPSLESIIECPEVADQMQR